ncbi:MAG: hypothetical protein LBS52_05375, partial [Dysgonamonadaceae bacterium]|jgi:hypothetical protein|nr:hypothetical protein [Dysgonamonadaceae bacterium]
MLKWAYNVQATQLLKGMLPFNGDETFVAGGLLPRTTLMDGSAEATLLFINGGEALLKWTAQNKPKEQLDATVLQAVKKSFADNFIINNRLATNNPARMNGETYPAFRHGICENLGNTEGCEFFGWTQCTANNRYLCPHCFATVNLPKATPETYFLPSVTLMPFYTRDEFVDRKVLLFQLQELADYYRANNVLPSKLAHTETNKITGYDYGFFLYALTQTGNPLASQVYNDMLAALDNTGAWVEYYENGVPCGTLCRPWESAINLEAAINYVITKN